MRLKIADWPMIVKLGIGPVVSLVMLIFIAVIGISGLDNQVNQLTNVVNINLKGGAELSKLSANLSNANGNLYRITTLQAAEADDLDMAEEMQSLRNYVDDIISGLKSYKAQYLVD